MKESPIIPRSEGVTIAERYLKKLCDKSFLSMWSYTGIFNDRCSGQEICDLLVVFGNDIIIFSDKDCAFPNTGDIELDWKRWYRKAIKKSADQVYGAERWILKFPDRIFLDQACKTPFPIELPSLENKRIHRIVVAHAASAKCKELFGGSGSLMIDTQIKGDSSPFTIGQIEENKGFIHIFDDTVLDIALKTLDTISDFVKYLEKKEAFFSNGIAIHSTGEEELLGRYLKDINQDGEHDFLFNFDGEIENYNAVFLDDEGTWIEFSQNPQRKAQIEANKISYTWDRLIETFSKHIFEGTSVNYHDKTFTLYEKEKILRFMASENRTQRRLLSQHLIGLIKRTPKGSRGSQTIQASGLDKAYYVFLLFPFEDFMPYDEYRKVRSILLQKHMLIAKLRFPEAQHIVGIATETGLNSKRSEDAAYLATQNWEAAEKAEAELAEKELKDIGLLGKQIQRRTVAKEYPYEKGQILDFQKSKGRSKNLPCICGSGRKFKKCCGALG